MAYTCGRPTPTGTCKKLVVSGKDCDGTNHTDVDAPVDADLSEAAPMPGSAPGWAMPQDEWDRLLVDANEPMHAGMLASVSVDEWASDRAPAAPEYANAADDPDALQPFPKAVGAERAADEVLGQSGSLAVTVELASGAGFVWAIVDPREPLPAGFVQAVRRPDTGAWLAFGDHERALEYVRVEQAVAIARRNLLALALQAAQREEALPQASHWARVLDTLNRERVELRPTVRVSLNT